MTNKRTWIRSTPFRIIAFACALVWLGVIFYLSSMPYQKQSIQPLLRETISQQRLEGLLPDVKINYNNRSIAAKDQPYNFIEFVFRKSSHMAVYGIFAVLLSLAWARSKEHSLIKVYVILCVVALAGMADELNQMHVKERTGMFQDVGFDLLGGLLGVLLACILGIFRFHQKDRHRR